MSSENLKLILFKDNKALDSMAKGLLSAIIEDKLGLESSSNPISDIGKNLDEAKSAIAGYMSSQLSELGGELGEAIGQLSDQIGLLRTDIESLQSDIERLLNDQENVFDNFRSCIASFSPIRVEEKSREQSPNFGEQHQIRGSGQTNSNSRKHRRSKSSRNDTRRDVRR